MIAVIDYGAGNLQSVQKALRFIGCDCCVVKDRDALLQADGAILPGVGSFADAMDCMEQANMKGAVLEYADTGKPLLGICLGLHLLFDSSEESPGAHGLGLLKGSIQRIPPCDGLKIPHMGWNSLQIKKADGLYQGITGNPHVYFVHSYYLKAEDAGLVSAQTEYGVCIDASVQTGNLFATQFHPEKSGEVGLQMLRNFVVLTKKWGK